MTKHYWSINVSSSALIPEEEYQTASQEETNEALAEIKKNVEKLFKINMGHDSKTDVEVGIITVEEDAEE